ncbi:hypothetical protein C1J03_03100 [Sulfitobacter sp. SK012]|uniref:hypothetical protein n=1 Tax=Sulfitobacter sp. SK012 TaxID=1389005 RepID=UPI000E0B9718|nr:hypothetical protein [Sulfitobacter sp. SK012]AXI45110.1 hypothetical protein C1J03_03100 [Sulfitobacter sp. SK012]
MTLKSRLVKMEKAIDGGGGQMVDCIYLCDVTKPDAPSNPRVALLMGGALNDSVSRLPDESASDFIARVEGILEGRK